MKFIITDSINTEIVSSLEEQCTNCLLSCIKENISISCPSNGEERRCGTKENKGVKIFLCESKKSVKTAKLFKEKIEILFYCIPSIIKTKEKAFSEASISERDKYSKIVHNLKTLNAQSIQSLFKFIPQNVYVDNYHNLYEFVKNEILTRPHDATIALLRLSKNNAHMKTEFSTHEKLSVENPNLLIQEHNIRSVILNVYHSFEIDFIENNKSFKISDYEYFIKFDYDTIRVALYHIFSNAVKYICKNSKLYVNFIDKDEKLYIDFEMRSLYIDMSEKEAIFNDHYSGKSTMVKQKNGSGLGMGLIKKALQINGAEIDVIPGTKIYYYDSQEYSDNVFRLIFKK